jgi:hypothetical protein
MRALTDTEQIRMLAEMPVANRAVLRELRIQWDPVDVVFTVPKVVHKDGTVTAESVLPAQTVRVQYQIRAMIEQGTAGLAPVMYAIVDGVRDHPTEPDTIMDEGYTFVLNNDDAFRITDVILIPGGIRGIARAMG